MDFLLGLWIASLTLAAAALLVMALLILRRIILTRQDGRLSRRRDALFSILLRALDRPGDTPRLPERIRRRDRLLLSELVYELLRTIRGQDRTRLIALIESLGLVEDDLRVLRRGRERSRLAAARRLSAFDRADVGHGLTAALDDPSPEVRLAAATALAERGAELDPRLLVEKLGIGPRERSRLLRGIFRKLARTAPGRLAALLAEPGPDLVKVLVLDALAAARDYAALEPIVGAAQDRSVNVRANAVRALGLLGHPESWPAIAAAMADPAWPVRTQAAIAAGRLGAVEAIPVLVTLLDDPQWWARYRAAQALRRLGESGLQALEAASRTGSRAGRVAQMLLEERAA